MINEIIEKCKSYGWILEPYANEILKFYNIEIPDYIFTDKLEEALNFFKKINSPVVCKVVSTEILHKSDVGGVIIGINTEEKLKDSFYKLMKLNGAIGVIVEKMVKGVELIIGAKNDLQFGPVVICGMGGIGVEIYKDTSIRMAPLNEKDAESMLKQLKFYPILKGFRGQEGINLKKLIQTLINFSKMLMDLGDYFESIDLNPVICSKDNCYVADARIILSKNIENFKKVI